VLQYLVTGRPREALPHRTTGPRVPDAEGCPMKIGKLAGWVAVAALASVAAWTAEVKAG
jgi:hypothetical protein